MNTEGFITKIRELIIANTSLTSAYSPDLPQEDITTCCVTLLEGNTTDSLCNTNLYNSLPFRVLIRGTENDKTTRAIADEVFDTLHLLKDTIFTGGTIINILAKTPVFVMRDENQRLLYNITFSSNVKGE